MTLQDGFIIAIMFVGVAVMGYAMGRRTGSTRTPPKKRKPPPQAAPVISEKPPAPEEPASSAEEPAVVTKPPAKMPAAVAEQLDALPVMHDATDDFDVTKVGAAATAPPP